MKILLAAREQEKSKIIFVLQKTEVLVEIVDTLSDFEKITDNFELALVDEDFGSLQTGWQLALKIRNKRPSARIVMIVRSNPKQEYLPLYDVTLSLPISEDELIGEVNRG